MRKGFLILLISAAIAVAIAQYRVQISEPANEISHLRADPSVPIINPALAKESQKDRPKVKPGSPAA